MSTEAQESESVSHEEFLRRASAQPGFDGSVQQVLDWWRAFGYEPASVVLSEASPGAKSAARKRLYERRAAVEEVTG